MSGPNPRVTKPGRGDAIELGVIVASPEFQALHGAQSNAAFVTSLYQDGLGRVPDAAGGSFYTGLLNSGAASQAVVVLDIATSPEAAADLTANLA